MATSTPKKSKSNKRRRGESHEFVSPNPQPKKQPKKSSAKHSQEDDQNPPAPAAAATTSCTIDSTTATAAEKMASAFHRVSAAVMFKPILKQDEAAETHTTSGDDLMPPPMIKNPSPRKSSPPKSLLKNGAMKTPPAKASQEPQHTEEETDAVDTAQDHAAAAVHVSLVWRGQTLIQWKDNRQLWLGVGSLILSLLLLTYSLVLVLQSYYKASCHVQTWELQQRLRDYDALIDSRHMDRKLFQQQQQQIRMWTQESKAKQAQMIGIKQQCQEDWNQLQECTYTHAVAESVKEDLWALQEPFINQHIEKLQEELTEVRKTNQVLEHEAKELQNSLADMTQTAELEQKRHSATTEEYNQALVEIELLQRDLSDLQFNIQDYSRQELISW
jgi:hypothetical protein